jgi:hypothetical protein
MKVLASVCLLAASVQAQPSPLEVSVAWATAQADRFAIVSNPVVSAHSLARLGELVCPHDRIAAAGVYRKAIVRINTIKLELFFDQKQPVFPVASFTGLWRRVSASVKKCDAAMESLLDTEAIKQRRADEWRDANNSVIAGLSCRRMTVPCPGLLESNPERAAQLMELVLEAGDPDAIDFGLVEWLLVELRGRAPELGDKVFRIALETVVNAPRGSTSALSQLGSYLFVSPADYAQPDTDNLTRTIAIGSSTVYDLRRVRSVADPDSVDAYMRALIRLSERALNPKPAELPLSSFDTTVAYALALQLIPHARELELTTADDLQQLSTRLHTNQAGQVENAIGQNTPDNDASDANRTGRRMREILALVRRKKFDEARRSMNALGDSRLSPRLNALINFAEAAAEISSGDLDKARRLASGLQPGGVKRALLYAGIANKSDLNTAMQLASLAGRDAQSLPAEFRAGLLSAITVTLLRDSERAYPFMRDIVTAMNDARINPRAARFEPRPENFTVSKGAGGGTDVSGIPLAASRFWEVLDTGSGRYNFDLGVTGVDTFNLPAMLSRASRFDPQRLEALVLSLRDDEKQAEAMVAIAALRLKVAETEEEVPVGAR